MSPIAWSDLSAAQQKTVESEVDLLVVRGPAGSGKTTVALWCAGEHLRRNAAEEWERVLFLTFSRSAVAQIRERARGALAGLDERIEIQTFHAFAYRLIVAFGRYAGMGHIAPRIQSAAEAALLGNRDELLRYDDLVPLALELLGSSRLRDLIATRWPLVICDEFQDTAPDQSRVIERLHERARLVLLADRNQMIYAFIKGVDGSRLTKTEAIADDIIDLERRSQRDPTQIIPAMAAAVLRRDFQSGAVIRAVREGRLMIRSRIAGDEELVDVLRDDLGKAWALGDRTFGIYGHSNQGVAILGSLLADAGIDHVLVGIPEAQGEAVTAMAAMVAFGLGESDEVTLHRALATFMTACTRGGPPSLSADLVAGRPLPTVLAGRLRAMRIALQHAADPRNLGELTEVATKAWEPLGITQGSAPWRRASPLFASQVRAIQREHLARAADIVAALHSAAERIRAGALVQRTEAALGSVQLMNFHQTKGREADCIALVYRQGDYLAHRSDTEPFEKPSRVLYVALTRARNHVLVLLPPDPHPLVAPFEAFAETSANRDSAGRSLRRS